MNFVDDYLGKLKEGLDELDRKKIAKIVDVLFKAWQKNKQVFIIGNGGSAATASHFACDLGKEEAVKGKKRFRATALTDNTALMTALANDLGYEEIFSEQLKNLVNREDVLIAITGSGNSPNIIQAVKTAKKMKAQTIAFLGFDGGKVKKIVDHFILFKQKHYGRVEDAHLILEHLISFELKDRIKKAKK